MVTIGKPMGNGHPVSAVVTTREIAKQYKEAVGEDAIQIVSCVHPGGESILLARMKTHREFHLLTCPTLSGTTTHSCIYPVPWQPCLPGCSRGCSHNH